jgi:RNA-binding protein YlmH
MELQKFVGERFKTQDTNWSVLIRKGRVRVNGKIVFNPAESIQRGDTVSLHADDGFQRASSTV